MLFDDSYTLFPYIYININTTVDNRARELLNIKWKLVNIYQLN